MKPILFDTKMVRAILDGRKTQTRRVIKSLDGLSFYRAEPSEDAYEALGKWDFFYGWLEGGVMFDACASVKAPYSIGDILWVRETWNHVKFGLGDWHYEYRADYDDTSKWRNGSFAQWRPSIHMPRDAARIFLRVNDVQVERLNEISQSDAIDEGALTCDLCETDEYKESCEKAKREGSKPPIGYSPRERFAALWDSTIKNTEITKYGWAANPWVWVIKFERCERPDSITFISTMLS